MTESPSGAVSVPLAAPVHAQALRYTRLFDGKPFAEAVLVYRANGSYTILSPGEDHHGSYVATTDVRSGPVEVDFISWPSADWDDDVARHTLRFDRQDGSFRQELRLPGTSEPLHQAGIFRAVDVADLVGAHGWAAVRERYAPTFAELDEAATSP